MYQVPNTFPELFWAYTAVWALFFFYLVFLASKLRKVEKKVHDLSAER